MPDGMQLLTDGFKLDLEQRGLIIRAGWVVIVSFHIMWVCGLLAWAGFGAPFALSGDLRQLQMSSAVSARLSLANEIRAQVRLRCDEPDWSKKGVITNQIERLQEEYQKYSAKGERYPEPSCN